MHVRSEVQCKQHRAQIRTLRNATTLIVLHRDNGAQSYTFSRTRTFNCGLVSSTSLACPVLSSV